MRFSYTFTFEHDEMPVAVRGVVDRKDPEEALKSAVFQAFKQSPKVKCDSWVLVVQKA